MTEKWNNKKSKRLFEAFLKLKNASEVANFCRDLLTEDEISEFASRWEVAQKLNEGKSQRAVSKETKVSIATVTRVNYWLTKGMNGYKTVLNRMSKKSSKSKPVHQHP
jgi:TrpR-related protein YerC/YecD